ncbi:MAG: hypothetical protein K0R57_6146 [Paenibacillaceae bacterium]|jgi:hypothetical protein|nr:hypothetical protein [Paenibacillaceae bacterium]
MKDKWEELVGSLGVQALFEALQQELKPQMDDSMIRRPKGHTKAVAELASCHPGRETSQYYAAAVSLGKMEEAEGLGILGELENLQVSQVNHPQFGGFRWYREETAIDDSNAAFFTLVPIANLALTRPHSIPCSHQAVIHRMFRRAIRWFSHECGSPKLYYPNKILSDGALLLALSAIVGDREGQTRGEQFFARWEEYTARRGWGWGENTSTGYLKIMLDAFQLALRAWNKMEEELQDAIRKRRNHLLDYIRFHDGVEFVPSIRSYNFEGQVFKPSAANLFAGVRFWRRETLENTMDFVLSLLLYEDLIPAGSLQPSDNPRDRLPAHIAQPVPRTWTEPVFDGAFAYTWIGRHCRMGSLNRFPVMPGSYQWPTWGLGWQSMPVSFLVEEEQVSFLRYTVREGGRFRSHLSADYHHAYLNPALFSEEYLPEIETLCTQKDNVLIVQRNIVGLANSASEIVDEWFIQRFRGKVHRLNGNNKIGWTSTASVTHSLPQEVESSDHPWVVLEYETCYAAILALGYWGYGAAAAQASEPEICEQDGNLRLTRVLYRGEEQFLRQHRLDNAWVVVMFDEKCSVGELQEKLQRMEVTDRRFADYEVPRNDWSMIREISVRGEEGFLLRQRVDPYA